MKTKPCLIIILAATAGLITACNRTEPPPSPQTTADTTAAMKDSAVQARDEFLASMDKKMAELDKKIDHLATESANATGDAKVRIDQSLANLQTQRDAVRKEYNELKASTGDAWDKTKAAFQSAWDGLVKTYDEAAAKVSSS